MTLPESKCGLCGEIKRDCFFFLKKEFTWACKRCFESKIQIIITEKNGVAHMSYLEKM